MHRFAYEGYEIPEAEKPKYENVTYAESDYSSYTYGLKYNGLEYQPPIVREKLQISLWRADNYTWVKTRDKYFTPSHSRFYTKGREGFKGFNMNFSLDGEHIVLIEKRGKASTNKEQLIVIIDAFTFDIVKEYSVPYSLNYIAGVDVFALDETNYDDDFLSWFWTKSTTPNIYVWNHGKYILYGQTIDEAVSIIQYEFWDTETNK